ncbi:uncharacterized protein RCC_04387 [Ramularia collo-cygni]|uniref:Uncharacterized protein n=1 Tax=Ramularia collo-cygni TaxID=112498 RepID=A0A2D3VDB1_9PEZI|nr:uncharacterized protein RCC_04387 [Ramularia collo-cygni]CZT18543.1 uncharacterized protein RCC_04387 [Ramularia collo-cygni]
MNSTKLSSTLLGLQSKSTMISNQSGARTSTETFNPSSESGTQTSIDTSIAPPVRVSTGRVDSQVEEPAITGRADTGTVISPKPDILEPRIAPSENAKCATLESQRSNTTTNPRPHTPRMPPEFRADTRCSSSLVKAALAAGMPPASTSDPVWHKGSKFSSGTQASPPGKRQSLTNRPHPLLWRDQFIEQAGSYWYFTILRSLQLTSRLLMMDAVTKHIVVMVDGELRRDTKAGEGGSVKTDLAELAGMKDDQGQPLHPNVARYPKPGQEMVDDSMRARAAQILMELRPLVRFRIDDIRIDDMTDGTCLGTTRSASRCWAEYFPPDGIPPNASIITINGSIFDNVAGYCTSSERNHTSCGGWDLQIEEVIFATTMFHEIFHALDRAFNRPHLAGVVETFFGDCVLAECGFAATAAVFDGIPVKGTPQGRSESRLGKYRRVLDYYEAPDPSKGYAGNFLKLEPWPSKCFAEWYEDKIPSIKRDASTLLDKGCYIVSMSFVEDIFTDEYWNVEVPKLGQSPLRVPKVSYLPIKRETKALAKALRLSEELARMVLSEELAWRIVLSKVDESQSPSEPVGSQNSG